MDSLEDDRVTGRLLYTLRSNSFMTLMAASVVVLLLAGMVISARTTRSRIHMEDQTWSVEQTMSDSTITIDVAEDSDKQVRDLSDLGYSPEVAKAILENEDRARRRRN